MTRAAGMRPLVLGLLVVAALVLQTSLVPHLTWRGVGPDLVLLVVVACGLAYGSREGMLIGFAAGLLVDLAPPSDHVAGRWALALLAVGYVAGRVRPDGSPSWGTTVVAAAACSFFGASLFALSGLILADHVGAVPALLDVVLAGVVADVVLAALLLGRITRGLRRISHRDRLEAVRVHGYA
ncbi:rod shape-determining protein MreD [Nocardioides sp. R-C-SC26]|uniref:rod shape-determining protein MreD n=1 Tax=Nocardioides sp. R-C-SC26 TaxID=2870414 RepID=UPI001E41CD17|nr:rod shape-determining protein MreD [Nocardioides sp. R-C-SC26]